MTKTDPPAPVPLTELVCLGACQIENGKPGMRWAPVANLDAPSLEQFALPRKVKSDMARAFVGAVYAVPMTGSSITTGSAKYVRSVADHPRVLEWVIKHEAQLGQERGETVFKRAKGEALEAALKDMAAIRRAYKATDHWGRTIIEARLLQWLRSPS